ncbi:PREDICTED: transcription termination factor 1 [Nanorana parkeri]|uniref:transcription termination factor 1 n=1 Tax=Nanorana parkeri TaxID=125878 RepID=UPI0008542DE8|nr:PREDICTED: transcription termination factor 1 [Nanorana parkeri]
MGNCWQFAPSFVVNKARTKKKPAARERCAKFHTCGAHFRERIDHVGCCGYVSAVSVKEGDISFSDNGSYSEHNELEGSGKKKKKKNKHRTIDDETLMEVGSSDNLSPSYSHNSFVKYVKQKDTSEQESSNWDCNSNTQESPKKRKKKKEIEVSVEEADNTGQPNFYDGHFDEVSVIEEAPFSESIRKKKKRHRPSETRSLEEDVLEDVQPSPLITLNDHIELEDSVRRKKKKHRPSEISSLEEDVLEDVQPSPLTTLNDNTELEDSVRRKKKKHRPSEISSLEEDALEDVQPSPLTTLNDNIELEASVKRKKKKHRPSEISSLEEDALEDVQPSPLTTLNDNTELEDSVRRKKKKHRPSEISSLEEDALEDVQPSPLTTLNDDTELEDSLRRKKKKHRPSEISSLEEDVLEDVQPSPLSTLNYHIELEDSVRRKRKKHRLSDISILEKVALEEISSSLLTAFKDNIDLENSVRGMKKRRTNILKEDNMGPKQSNKDHAIAEEKEEIETNFDASEREAFKNITEATNGKTDDIVGTPAKNNKSALGMKSGRDRKQDVTAELEEPDQDEMENTLDQETSDLQEVNRLKQNRPSMSGIEVLGSLPKRDVALLEEYFPRIRSLSGKSVTDLVNYELHRIKDAKAKGIKFLTGRFESTEDELIKKNVEEFLKIGGLESGEILFHSYRFPDKKRTVEQLKKKYHFRQRIAKGLARTVLEVNGRGAKLYDLSGNKGRFTKQEVEKLQKLMGVHGNQWTTVAPLVGRSSASVQSKASQIKLEVTGGKWNIDEVNRLLEAVKTFIMSLLKRKKMLKQQPHTVPKEMLFTGIPWRQIAEKVQTRNWTHCKSKWNDILLLRMNNGFSPCEGALGLQTNIEIIKW